ncbi:MAG: DUF6790 family protein [Chlamydiota bacterium]
MYPLILFVLALVAAIIHLVVTPKAATASRTIEVLLSYIIPLNIGIGSLMAFAGHAFYGPDIAKIIGWVAGSPFQSQVSAAYLALGVAGLISIWWRQGFWIATSIISALFVFGTAYVHFLEMSEGHLGSSSSGVFLYTGDLLIPAVYLILAYFYGAGHNFFKPSKRR